MQCSTVFCCLLSANNNKLKSSRHIPSCILIREVVLRMYDAYEALPILEKLPLQIECIAAYGKNLNHFIHFDFSVDITRIILVTPTIRNRCDAIAN